MKFFGFILILGMMVSLGRAEEELVDLNLDLSADDMTPEAKTITSAKNNSAKATPAENSLLNFSPITKGPSGFPFKKAVKNKSRNAKVVHIVKEEPKGCTYLADYGYSVNAGYMNMYNGLRDAVVDIGGNYYVIDAVMPSSVTFPAANNSVPTGGILPMKQNQFSPAVSAGVHPMLYGRIFACPKGK